MVDKLLLNRGLKAVVSQYEIVPKDRNTRDHLAWTIGNGDPMPKVCTPSRIPRTWERGSYARGVYPWQDTSSMGSTRAK